MNKECPLPPLPRCTYAAAADGDSNCDGRKAGGEEESTLVVPPPAPVDRTVAGLPRPCLPPSLPTQAIVLTNEGEGFLDAYP